MRLALTSEGRTMHTESLDRGARMARAGLGSSFTPKVLAALSALVLPWAPASADGPDVFDQFFRYADSEHRAFYTGLPDESVDPFSGNLQIVQTDVVLPGKAGLDLRIVRSYSRPSW